MIKHYISEIGKVTLCLAFGLIMGWLTSLWALPTAYMERGYHAFGSEWLLIFLFGWTGYILMYKLVRR